MALHLGAAGLVGMLLGCRQNSRAVLSEAAALELYARPLAAPPQPLSVFHLGHSLVGRDMPAMLTQLAGAGHISHSQLGWGTSLKNHWDNDINGHAVENDHPAARPANVLEKGGYDAVVFTEMVEIRDAIRYHDSANYLERWAGLVRKASPDTRLYLYETWPNTDDPNGWLARVDGDLAQHWEDDILLPAVRASGQPIYVIPGGQALAATIRAVMAQGQVDGIAKVEDFFARAADGTPDTIHFNDLGAYVIAATHYAVLYHANPAGLPAALRRADGSPAEAPSPRLASLIQQCVWDVVTHYSKTGVTA